MDIEFVDVDHLDSDQKAKLERALFTWKPRPCFMFRDRFLFSILAKTDDVDDTELKIIEHCLNECATRLRAYYQYASIPII